MIHRQKAKESIKLTSKIDCNVCASSTFEFTKIQVIRERISSFLTSTHFNEAWGARTKKLTLSKNIMYLHNLSVAAFATFFHVIKMIFFYRL